MRNNNTFMMQKLLVYINGES